MRYSLSDVCFFVNEQIPTSEINLKNYISTENMLPGKNGIQKASSLPNTQNVRHYKKKDILISNIRPYFKKIWFAEFDGGCSADVLVFRSYSDKISSEFLFELLSQDAFFNYVMHTSKGTKMPRGDKNAIMNFEFELLDRTSQNFIGTTGGNIYLKIKNNNQIIEILEEIAASLFENWFVRFNFPDKDGNPYKSSGGKMVDSELGEIPDGWVVSSLPEIANYQNGLAMQKFRPKGEASLPVIKIKELNQGFVDSNSERCDVDIKDSVTIYDGDVIFSWSATLLVKIWTGGTGGLNQHLFKVTSDEYRKWFYYYWTKKHIDNFINIAKDKATTMGHINKKHLEQACVLIPNANQMDLFDEIMTPFVDQLLNIGLENETLKELRDTLLPKLLSGEIELPTETEV